MKSPRFPPVFSSSYSIKSRAKNRKSLKAAPDFCETPHTNRWGVVRTTGARVAFHRPGRLLAQPVAINPMPGAARHSRGPMRQVYLRATAGISLPHCRREVRSVCRARYTSVRMLEGPEIVQDRPRSSNAKMPFRLASVLRISLRLPDDPIGTAPRGRVKTGRWTSAYRCVPRIPRCSLSPDSIVTLPS